MSAGGRSGGSRGSGRPGAWEEAGSEFYQESYPGADFDLDPFNKDPNYFTTLLPSKQNRATVKRPRADNKATFKRRNSGYYSTMGNTTVPNEIHCAMMPDLSQNLATEESTWEEIMLIKSMPVNMAQKKEIKAKLLSAEIFRLQGFKQFKWRRRKMWERMKAKKKEYCKKLDLWRSCIRTVRGNFGTGVATYFSFIKWLMLLNFFLALILGVFVFAPSLLFEKESEGFCFPLNETASVACCKEKYFDRWSNDTTEWDLAIGSGWLEHTVLLYGYYSSILITCCLDRFDMRIAYLAAWIACLVISLLGIMRKGFRRLKSNIVERQGGCYKYCTLVFSGWDFCLYSEKGKEGRHRAIRTQILDWFEEDDDYEKRWGRSIGRFCAKCVAASVVAAQGAILWFVFDLSLKHKYEGMWAVILGYLPSGVAASAHAIIPSFIKCLSPYYSCLTRSAAPRLATVAALLGAFYYVVHCKPNFEKCYEPCPSCWETLFGQHVTRLIAAELAMLVSVTFLLDLPRSFCSRKSPFCSLEFQVPQHVCHLLYFQTLVFLASFHAPFLPVAATAIFLFMFYLKKFSCLINSTPSATLYRASRSKSLYIILTLFCYFIAVIPWIYSLVSVVPSQSCGPYSGFKNVSVFIVTFYSELPFWVQVFFKHSMSPVVTVPLLLLLLLCLYYYFVIAKANRDLVVMLKKQLILEGHDKQFLLNRLSALIKQHQERHKPRSIDPPPPPPPNLVNSS